MVIVVANLIKIMTTKDSLQGYLLIDKPAGWTSFDVVAKVRNQMQKCWYEKHGERRRIKVGHVGTLDPMATGLLVILVGGYTKLAPQMTKLDKTYEVEMTLGQVSTTGDQEGELTEVSSFRPSQSQVESIVASFVGEIDQVPPAYSAIKVNGQRAYKLARQGKDVKLEPRKVKVGEIHSLVYEYPVISFTCDVSSGTYIRSLTADIGQKLGTGAFMSRLRRSRVGKFEIVDAVSPEVSLSDADLRILSD